jgi:hypothetical protein
VNASTHEVRATRTATPVLVQAIEPVPGLHVYEQPEELLKANEHYPWRLGHHSGLVIAVAMYEDDAIRGAHKIADMADWTKTADEVRATVDADEVHLRLAWTSCEQPALA